MFEHHHEPLLPRRDFLRRQVRYTLVAGGIVSGSLLIGMAGYHTFENLPWLDSFLNASMILGGMGPVTELHTPGGKIFAGFYALYSGLVFLVITAVLFAPLLHRFLHNLHLEMEADGAQQDS